jgi:dihydrofolate synthase / folylpolyglutamate synthase
MTSEDLARLFSLTNEYRSMKYDLRNMQVLMEHLGNPQNSFHSALIAGTNGKGSVAALLSAMMPEAGLYTSPHLARLNERIRIDRQEISDPDLKHVYDEVDRSAAAASASLLYPPTYFEMVTAMAFKYFQNRVGFAVLEVGLGGRLDATNVVRQDVSVITSIALDHQEFLGSTLEAIASEKAGIIKGQEPVVVGPEAELEPIVQRAGIHLVTTRQLERRGRSLGHGYFEIDIVTPTRFYSSLRPQLPGRHQIENVVVAVRTAECLGLSKEDIEHGVNTAAWPGRLERIPGRPAFLLDGAHNPSAAQRLAGFLAEFYPEGVTMIFACMSDKNYREMLASLRPRVRRMIFTKTQSNRSEDPAKLQELVSGSSVEPSLADAIQSARAQSNSDETILICGSLYLVGEARAQLVKSADPENVF